MFNEGAKKFLEDLGSALSEQVIRWYIVEDEYPTLIFEKPSVFDKTENMVFAVTMSPVEDEMILFDLLITVMSHIPEECFGEIHRLSEDVNNACMIGKFLLFEDMADLVCSHGIIFDAASPAGETAVNIMSSLGIMEFYAIKFGARVYEKLYGDPENDENDNDM